MDRDELREHLRSSYVLFPCEGTAEAVCIGKLVIHAMDAYDDRRAHGDGELSLSALLT